VRYHVGGRNIATEWVGLPMVRSADEHTPLLGPALRTLRYIINGLSVAEVAMQVGMKPDLIEDIEANRIFIDETTFRLLLFAYDTPPRIRSNLESIYLSEAPEVDVHESQEEPPPVNVRYHDQRLLRMPDSGAIFISYRRSDQPALAGRLYDRLASKFGENQIFMDVDDIEPGIDFVRALDDILTRCVVLIAVIGTDWLTATDSFGCRRLEQPDDFVRLEIQHALSREIRVIPVLADHAQMPRRADLPESIASLAQCNAYPVSHKRFGSDSFELLSMLEHMFKV
jgi:transcriptional regulator with XRE-family HTH domain